jgi:hypothetical protein
MEDITYKPSDNGLTACYVKHDGKRYCGLGRTEAAALKAAKQMIKAGMPMIGAFEGYGN